MRTSRKRLRKMGLMVGTGVIAILVAVACADLGNVTDLALQNICKQSPTTEDGQTRVDPTPGVTMRYGDPVFKVLRCVVE